MNWNAACYIDFRIIWLILFVLFLGIYKYILSKRKKKKIIRNDLLNKLVPKEAFYTLLDDCSKSV